VRSNLNKNQLKKINYIKVLAVAFTFLLLLKTSSFPSDKFGIENLRLDHMNIVMKNLDKATAFFKKMGFTVKPGRLHQNSILNNFIKFQNGSSIELMTAFRRKDELSKWYVDYIAKHSSGAGAFLCLRTDSSDELYKIEKLLQLQKQPFERSDLKYANILNFNKHESLHPVFFINYKNTIIDSANFINHTNTTNSLYAVWINTAGNKNTKKNFTKLSNGNLDQIVLPGPIKFGEVLKLKTGYIYLVQDPTTDRIAGITVTVTDKSKTKELLERSLNRKFNFVNTSRGESIIIPPKISFGVWLEFLQLNRSSEKQKI